MAEKTDKIEEIAKRRGFFWQSAEIYGGLSGFYDYGHLGILVKRKFENAWRNFFLDEENFYEIQVSSIVPENVVKASGHITSFVDPIVRCKKCGNSERADHIIEDKLKENFEGLTPQQMDKIIREHDIRCPKCGGQFEEIGTLNMMFPLTVGTGKEAKTAFLLPETAQGAYINFKRAYEHLRKKLPMGLAIVGRAYRNEISPRNSLIRMREFTQAELQIFFDPQEIENHEKFSETEKYKLRVKWHDSEKIEEISCSDMVSKMKIPKFYVYYMSKMQKFFLEVLKTEKDKFRFRELSEEERAFYNKLHFDIELNLDIGWKEVAGCHYRTNHDLTGHEKISRVDMSVLSNGKKVLPHVLELSFGVDRNVYSLIKLSYEEEKERSVLHFPFVVSPFDCAVFPLVNKDELDIKSKIVYDILKKKLSVFYDDSGSIGRRYRRMDEIGVPFCITIDSQTKEDDTVTVRERDSMKQERVKIEELADYLEKNLS